MRREKRGRASYDHDLDQCFETAAGAAAAAPVAPLGQKCAHPIGKVDTKAARVRSTNS